VERTAAGVLSESDVVLDGIGAQVCGACARGIGPEQPSVHEYLRDDRVEAVEIPAGGSIGAALSACLLAVFHVDCWAILVAPAGPGPLADHVLRCTHGKHAISSPRRLSRCPICAGPLVLAESRPAGGGAS
jgi:hypothetical protein